MPRRSRAEIEAELAAPVRLVEPAPEPLPPPPPEHLSPRMRAWWTAVVNEYLLQPHHLHLLECAADAWDRMVQAREVLRREGLTVPTAGGSSKRHPASEIERDSRLAFARLVRELDLDVEPPPSDKPGWRPPALSSNRRR